MSNNKAITAVCGVVAAVGLVATGAALANASSPANTAVTGSYGAASGGEATDGVPGGPGRPGGNHTPVTGTELDKVKAAVKAKDSAVTVTSVRKDEDGSYDVFGTKAGAPVMLEVSKDLKTVTTREGRGGPGGFGGGGHGGDHTPVTGTELDKVKAAVKAKDSAVSVTSGRKDPDGSYDVFGTKAGAPVMLEVSKDLKTVTTNTHVPDGASGPAGAPRA